MKTRDKRHETRDNTSATRLAFVFFFISCLLSLVSCLSSCKHKTDSLTLDYQYNYAPVDSGHYVIYDVDSIFYSNNGVQTNDTAQYQLMEMVGDTFYDNVNGLCNELDLYRRENENDAWTFDRKWWIKRTNNNFLKNEGDLKFVKLVFPPQESEDWNGNVYLPSSVPSSDPYYPFQNWDYIYSGVGAPYSVNNLNFDSTLTVSEVADTTDLIQRTIRTEVYAKNVGMIFQQWEYLTKQGDISANWETANMNGFRIFMRVREHN